MLKNSYLILLLCCFSLKLNAARASFKADSVINILKLTDQNLREKKLAMYIRSVFVNNPIDELNTDKIGIDKLLLQYNVENKAALDCFIESLYQTRKLNVSGAENALIKAIELAGKNNDHYLLYMFFSHLAFLQTYQGSTIEAVSNFRMAKKEAIILNDANLQVVIDINISDIYFRNNFYYQSLFYLNQALSIINGQQLNQPLLKDLIYNNKAENYFRMNKIDSLEKYHGLLSDKKEGANGLYAYRKRSTYYLYLLQHDYKNAIGSILALQKDKSYPFANIDKQNLADAYYNAGKPDSAKYIINQLLADRSENNHPEIKFHLYEVLGNIAEKENDYKQAVYNLKMALQQSEDHISRLAQVENITSQIKIDEMQGSYIQREENYKAERLWLIFAVIITLLAIVIVTLFYRSAKQKRYYEKLLFDTKKEELSFINSHEVRRHLSNILGIIETIKYSDDKHNEYIQLEDYLLSSAQNLDTAIKNISEKLSN